MDVWAFDIADRGRIACESVGVEVVRLRLRGLRPDRVGVATRRQALSSGGRGLAVASKNQRRIEQVLVRWRLLYGDERNSAHGRCEWCEISGMQIAIPANHSLGMGVFSRK